MPKSHNDSFENQTQSPDLRALVYVSTAVALLSPAQIEHLLERAQARNRENAVTGVLLYNSGNFMQYLEGPASGVVTVYQCIKADPNHHSIIELMHEPIQTRAFPEWAMAFRSSQKFSLPRQTLLNEELSERLAPDVQAVSTAHLLITRLWNKNC